VHDGISPGSAGPLIKGHLKCDCGRVSEGAFMHYLLYYHELEIIL